MSSTTDFTTCNLFAFTLNSYFKASFFISRRKKLLSSNLNHWKIQIELQKAFRERFILNRIFSSWRNCIKLDYEYNRNQIAIDRKFVLFLHLILVILD